MKDRRHPAAGVPVALAVVALVVPVGALPAPDADAGVRPEPHASILIEGDAGFLSPLSGVRGGSGTAADPFVISDWWIFQDRADGVRLVGTTAHVVLRNLTVSGFEGLVTNRPDCILVDPLAFCDGPAAVDLEDVSNVTIQNLRAFAGTYGVRVRDSADVVVAGAFIGLGPEDHSSTVSVGVDLRDVTRVALSNLTVPRADSPVFALRAKDVDVRHSRFVGRPSTLPLADVERFVAAHNQFVRVEIILSRVSSDVMLIENDFIEGASRAIAVSGAGERVDRLTVCGNRIANTTSRGGALDLQFSSGVVVRANVFENNFHGPAISASDVLFIENVVRDSQTRGLLIRDPTGARVHNNSFVSNFEGVGISLSADLRWNWWGHPTGPSGIGSGSGDPLVALAPVEFDPWLTSPPALTFDCIPGDTRGAQVTYDPTLEAWVRVDGEDVVRVEQEVPV